VLVQTWKADGGVREEEERTLERIEAVHRRG
jgi:hypothetical protein